MSSLAGVSLGLIAALLLGGCATATRSAEGAGRPASGFSWTNDDVIVEDTLVHRQLIEGRPPKFPDAERARGEEAAFLVAFVLDTTWYGKTLNGNPMRQRFRQEGAANALAEMKALRHCPP